MKSLVLTKNGIVVKKIKPPVGANDIHLAWRGRGGFVIVVFARDGKAIGVDIAPPGANDVGFSWEEGYFEGAGWTRDGKPFKKLPLPKGVNDVHVYVVGPRGAGRIAKGFWTRNGVPILPIPIPPGTNDAHMI